MNHKYEKILMHYSVLSFRYLYDTHIYSENTYSECS